MAEPVPVLAVLGTRPEAIKMLPVIRALREEGRLGVRVAATGQHREMVDQILGPFDITPDYDLDVMRANQGLNDIVGRVVPRLDRLYGELQPRFLIVQGDTTSAFAAGLAAFHRRIPVAHVEAGLRSYNPGHPYPEESNRRMLAAVADLHLAATPGNAANLVREGVSRRDIVVTGNTAIDSLLQILARSRGFGPRAAAGSRTVLITLHRRESWMVGSDGEGTALEGILQGIADAALEYPGVSFVYPVHRNPRVQEPARRILGGHPNVRLIDPLPYAPFVELMAQAVLILTDSGGIQEEAPSLGIPVLVARKTTERPEGVSCGANRLVGTRRESILGELRRLLDRPARRPGPRPCPNPFGDGQAGRRIRQAVLHRLGLCERPAEFLPGPRLETAAS